MTRQQLELQKTLVSVFCVGGPEMSADEAATLIGYSVESILSLLPHIPTLNYYVVRNAALDLLLSSGSSNGRAFGFLADGDAFDVLQNDRAERDRMKRERDRLLHDFAVAR